MESLRRWLQTLALCALALAALVWVLHGVATPAHATEPAQCKIVDSNKFMWDRAGADVASQTAELLDRAGDRRLLVVPFGRMSSGSGGNWSVVCVH
jgi:hypothetical protein